MGKAVTIGITAPPVIAAEWNTIFPWLRDIIKHGHGEMDVQDLYESIFLEKVQCWLIREEGRPIALCITQLVTFPKITVLRVVGLAGKEMKEWQACLDDTLKHFAQDEGCARIETVCRLGFWRRLRSLGVRPMYVVLQQEVK